MESADPAPGPIAPPRRSVGAPLAVALPMLALLAALSFIQIGDGTHPPRLALFLGRFHPALVHFPVALILLGLFLELIRLPGLRRIFPALPDPILHFVAWLAAIAALVAALAGWLLSQEGGYDAALLGKHLRLSVATGMGAVLCAVSRSLAAARPEQAIWRQIGSALIVVTTGVTLVAAQAGGNITHGEDYETQYAPDTVRRWLHLPVKRDRSKEPLKPLEERAAFADVVQPILESRCLSCHNEARIKGGLRVDSLEALLRGGESGPALEPGNAEASEMVRRFRLPLDEKQHMPPKGKPQLAPEEIAVLEWWIRAGVPDATPVGQLEITPEVRANLEKLLPESERRALEERTRQEAARLEATLQDLRKTLPGSLRAIVPGSRELEFSAASAGTAFGDKELAKLAAVGRDVKWLDLSRTGVTDAGLKALAEMPNLERLDLRGTSVTDEGAKALGGLGKLEALVLYGTQVTDACLDSLKNLKNLTRLYLAATKVTEAGEKKLRETLPQVEIVR